MVAAFMAIDGRAAEKHGHMAKILVIEDDAIARITIVQLLEEAGHQLLWAVNGLQGMAVFRGWQPDLVITDIIMPEQEGIQTIAEMRAAKPDAKIIAISGGGRIGNTDFLQIARQLGAMDVVPKPFDPDFLLAIVEACLARQVRASGSEGQAT
jgi:two-component system, chemotaxis family, chemotaxis protein CheY